MSRTLRRVEVGFCTNCSLPYTKTYGYTQEYGSSICKCDRHTCARSGLIFKWTYVYDTGYYNQIGDWKRIWNRKHRRESKVKTHKLKSSMDNGHLPCKMVPTFPIKKSQAAWSAY